MTALSVEATQLEPQTDMPFTGVSDVDVTDDGVIFLLARKPGVVVRYRTTGEYVGHWGMGDLVHPHGLTVDGDNVWVVDQYAHNVRLFTGEGRELDTIGVAGVPSDTGVDWSRPTYTERYLTIQRGGPPFNSPTKLVVAPDGSAYVTDGYGNARVHHFGPHRTLLRSWGEPGSGPGEFRLPHGLCVTDDSRVLVADRENDRIQCFEPDGGFVESWTDVQRPAAIVAVDDDAFLVAELAWATGQHSFVHGPVEHARPARLSILNGSGEPVVRTVLADAGRPGGPVARPHGLSVPWAGRVYVADLGGTERDPLMTISWADD